MKKKNIQSGVAFVEFAIILPLLLLITFGIIEFGLLMFNKQVITNASREGARAGIVGIVPRLSDTEIENITNQYCSNHLVTFSSNNNVPVINISGYDSEANFGDELTVNITYSYSFLIPSIWQLIGINNPLNLSATTTMKYE